REQHRAAACVPDRRTSESLDRSGFVGRTHGTRTARIAAAKMRTTLAALVTLFCGVAAPLGCQLIVGIHDRSVADDSRDGGTSADGGAEAVPACLMRGGPVKGFFPADSYEPSVRFTSNLLGAYLSRAPLPPLALDGADILYATRPTPDAAFGPFMPTSFSQP